MSHKKFPTLNTQYTLDAVCHFRRCMLIQTSHWLCEKVTVSPIGWNFSELKSSANGWQLYSTVLNLVGVMSILITDSVSARSQRQVCVALFACVGWVVLVPFILNLWCFSARNGVTLLPNLLVFVLSICLHFSSSTVIKPLIITKISPRVIFSLCPECLGQFSNMDREQDKCSKFAF